MLISWENTRVEDLIEKLLNECSIKNVNECIIRIAKKYNLDDKMITHILSIIFNYIFAVHRYITAFRKEGLMKEYLLRKGGIYEVPYLLLSVILGLPILPHTKISSTINGEVPEMDILAIIPIIQQTYHKEEGKYITSLSYTPHWVFIEITRSKASERIDDFKHKIITFLRLLSKTNQNSYLEDRVSFILISKIDNKVQCMSNARPLIPSVSYQCYLHIHDCQYPHIPIIITDIVNTLDVHIFLKVLTSALSNPSLTFPFFNHHYL